MNGGRTEINRIKEKRVRTALKYEREGNMDKREKGKQTRGEK